MRYRRGCRGWQLAALAFILDRATKLWVTRRSAGGGPLECPAPGEIIPGLVACRPVRNTGMAFSLLSNHPWLLSAVTALALAGIAAWLIARPDEHPLTRAGFWLIVGGGLGNLADRLALGYVIDFIKLEFVRFAIFNVADIAVCVGAGLALIGLMGAERGKERRDGG